MQFAIAFIFIFLACRGEHNEAHFEKSPNTRITEKRDLYCQLSRESFEKRKWAVSECDGLLFTALRGIGCGDVDISVFEDSVEPGKWHRNPAHDCFVADQVNNKSDSTISKDMYIGLVSYLLFKGDRDAIKRTIEYGESRDWIVGEAKDSVTTASKCYITPSLQGVLKDAANKLGGDLTQVHSEADGIGVQTGFQAHLQVLGILLRGKIDGDISNIDLSILKDQAKRQPNNALFAAAKAKYDDGDFSRAAALLSDEAHWPADKLPSSDNHCSDYLYQRDESPGDWGPCPVGQIWDGTDYIFAAAVYLGNF